MSDTVTLQRLESHLWEAANILRGPVDAADFKTSVFPLLFFKRLSDVHDEAYDAALAESGGNEEYALFPQHYRFQVPDGCHWRDVRAVPTNVGQALQKALRGVERANPNTLYGIFGDAQWTNKERLSDALLRDLVEHFSRVPLGSPQAGQANILSQSYEYLVKKFADATNKKANPSTTQGAEQVECCSKPSTTFGEQHGDDRTLWGKLFGQEKNLTTSAIARMNLFLDGAADFQVVRGDTMRNPAFWGTIWQRSPASSHTHRSRWRSGAPRWASDPYGRNFAGMTPDMTGDYAWVQHMVKSMAPKTGRMAVVLLHGALFRMGAEGIIRQKLLGMDLLEAVIGLGPNLFYGTGLATCILVIRQRKTKERRKRVLVIDASREFKTGRAQNELLPEHVEHICGWYRDYGDVKTLRELRHSRRDRLREARRERPSGEAQGG